MPGFGFLFQNFSNEDGIGFAFGKPYRLALVRIQCGGLAGSVKLIVPLALL
jgi:hypothetical protein